MKRYVIFANGEYDPSAGKHVRETDHIIAVDGGAEYALYGGFQPEIIIGDFDSLSIKILNQFPREKIIRYPVDKDSTDLELAVDYCVEQGSTELVLLHACGGRLDQMLGNMLLFTRSKYADLNIFIYCENQTVTLVRPDVIRSFRGKPGDGFSIIPLTASVKVKYLKGTKWTLYEQRLEQGKTLSLSNQFQDHQVHLLILSGLCLAVQIEYENEK